MFDFVFLHYLAEFIHFTILFWDAFERLLAVKICFSSIKSCVFIFFFS